MAAKRRKPENGVEKADLAIAETFAPIRKHRAVKVLGKASEVGDQPPLYVIASAVLGTGLAMGDRRAAKAGLRMIASHFIAIRIKNAAKHLVDRTRPNLIPEEGRYEVRKGKRFESDLTAFLPGTLPVRLRSQVPWGGNIPPSMAQRLRSPAQSPAPRWCEANIMRAIWSQEQ